MQKRRPAPPLTRRESQQGGAVRRLVLAASVACVVVAVDQLTTSWALHSLKRGPEHVIWKLDFQLAFNSGGAFSIAQGWAPVLGAFALVAAVVLLAFVRRAGSMQMAAAAGLVVGGALGNLADRLFRSYHGAVVDFIALHFWPTFNVADASVVVGCVWAAILLWRRQSPGNAEPDEEPRRSGA